MGNNIKSTDYAREYKLILIDHSRISQKVLEEVIEDFDKFNPYPATKYLLKQNGNSQKSLMSQYFNYRKSFNPEMDKEQLFICMEIPKMPDTDAYIEAIKILNKIPNSYIEKEHKEFQIKPLYLIAIEQFKELKNKI